ncbi:hypothetical protein L3Y34_003744 [Caenorhabditis briggsae]|uniref:Uncharacterized protein n=1 Tax=Caenorhabditis briggsae TaxID=6238 RepID=A0AAE9A742_CAEBR|nr:hypothetical protein L3Y34_003744 [Caenorhabditis briggsae]
MKGIEKKTRRMKSGKSLQTKGEEQIDGRSKGTSDEADRVQGTMELADLELDQGTHLLTPVKQAVDDIIESVDDMSNPLYELLSNDFKSKKNSL